MKWYTLYEPDTGRIMGRFTGDDTTAQANTPDGMAAVEGAFDAASGYIEAGEFVEFPTRPSQHHQFDHATKQWAINTAALWDDVRLRRNQLLTASDWTQLPDVPLATKTAWAAYRQSLRDITDQPDPTNLTWPVAPVA